MSVYDVMVVREKAFTFAKFFVLNT